MSPHKPGRPGPAEPILRCNDDQLGILEYTDLDNYWHSGTFYPLPAFEKYQALFDRLAEAWEATRDDDEISIAASDTAIDIQDKVNQLPLRVVFFSGRSERIRDLKIHKNSANQFEHKIDRG